MKQIPNLEKTSHRYNKDSLLSTNFMAEIKLHQNIIQNIKQNNQKKFEQSNLQIAQQITRQSPIKKQKQLILPVKQPFAQTFSSTKDAKNASISDTDKMIFQKKFKNFLNHRQQYEAKAKQKISKILEQRKNQQKGLTNEDFQNQYANKEEILNDNKGDNQFTNASDMLAFYEQITLGKKNKKNGVHLYHSQKIQYLFRREEFDYLILLQLGVDQRDHENELPTFISSVKKDTLLNYLFDQPAVMMLYSINPYQLGDQLAQFQTINDGFLTFQQFSNFLLIDREPTFFNYSKQNLEQARKLGRGIKCLPIISKWIADEQTYQWLIQIYRQVDILGQEKVQREVLSRKIRKQAQKKRIINLQIIQIVNISKPISLDRVLFQIQFSKSENGNDKISLKQFNDFLRNYKRLQTPQLDKLITKLILSGKYDPSYIFILEPQAIEILKQVFTSTQKFAQYFVLKQKFVEKLIKSPKFNKIRNQYVRSEGNRYVKKQNVEQTLVRFINEAQQYVDIEQILFFFSNRGRPSKTQHLIYLTNLQIQLEKIQDEERRKQEKKLSQGDLSTSSDEEQFQKSIIQKKVQRKKEKLASMRASETYTEGKKFVITVPNPFSFGAGIKQNTKVSIRQKKIKQQLQLKRRLEDQAMQPIKPRPVPSHVQQDLYEKLQKQHERERKQRLERFRLQSQQNMYPISSHLLQKARSKSIYEHKKVEHKFIAKPLPWYCEVNLLQRIQKQKDQRRQRILQQIINKHNDFDLSQGFKDMIKRGEQTEQQKQRMRALSKTTAGDPNLTFNPKITQEIPNFKLIHQHLQIDLQNKKQQKKLIQIIPFQFESRPNRSKTTHQPKIQRQVDLKQSKQSQHAKPAEGQVNIPITMKYEALLNLRKKQQQEKIRKMDEEKKASTVRKMRQQKFAPYVRSVLRNSQYGDIVKSRAIIEQKIKDFKKQERRKKQQYEEQMIKIYTKVFNRPLLVEGDGQNRQQNQQQNKRPSQSGHHNRSHHRQGRDNQKQQIQHFAEDYQMQQRPEQQYSKRHRNQEYDQLRRKAIEHPPRNYLMEDLNDNQQNDEQVHGYDQDDDQGQYLSQNGRYTN